MARRRQLFDASVFNGSDSEPEEYLPLASTCPNRTEGQSFLNRIENERTIQTPKPYVLTIDDLMIQSETDYEQNHNQAVSAQPQEQPDTSHENLNTPVSGKTKQRRLSINLYNLLPEHYNFDERYVT